MSFPGPPSGLWVFTLLLFGLSVSVLGESLRWFLARWSSLLRAPDPVERVLIDLFLGGAVFYVVGSIPFGLFVPITPLIILLLGAAAFAQIVYRVRKNPTQALAVERFFRTILRLPYLVAFGAAMGLYAMEVLVASTVGTGNSYDSSLFTIYVSLLLQHHSLPLSFQPIASEGLLYPQGTTPWFAVPQQLFSLPPARTSLLVTPLFWGLVPLGAFAWGRRLLGTERAGAAFALLFAFVGSWTRVLVGGSNDFVIAFPLVLLLAGWSVEWLRTSVLRWPDVLAFGALAGYSAAINPVGAQVLFVVLPISALFVVPRFFGDARRWFVRWFAAVAVALGFVIPSLYVLWLGHANAGFVPGAPSPPSGASAGLTFSQFIGAIDPFLFRPGDQMLSPLPFLRAELAILLVVGVLLAFLPIWSPPKDLRIRTTRVLLATGIVVMIGLLGVELVAAYNVSAAIAVVYLTSGAEISILLFVWLTAIAAIPLAALFEEIGTSPRPSGRGHLGDAANRSPARWRRTLARNPEAGRFLAVVALSALLVVPGVALTGVSLPGALHDIYYPLGNTSAADFDLFTYAQLHLTSGARVLVAPGSAAQFLPGYVSGMILLFPLVPGWMWLNASYNVLRTELSNGTLDPAGEAALVALQVGFVAVTGNTTVLWPPFSPEPFLTSPEFRLLFHEDDAYLFQRAGPPVLSASTGGALSGDSRI